MTPQQRTTELNDPPRAFGGAVHTGCSRGDADGDATMAIAAIRHTADGTWVDLACEACAATVSVRLAVSR